MLYPLAPASELGQRGSLKKWQLKSWQNKQEWISNAFNLAQSWDDYVYDAVGNLTSKTDRKNQTILYGKYLGE